MGLAPARGVAVSVGVGQPSAFLARASHDPPEHAASSTMAAPAAAATAALLKILLPRVLRDMPAL
jgi:hypothetical protein